MLPELLANQLGREELHPFAQAMLDLHGNRTGFFEPLTIDGEPRLDWEGFADDVALYNQLCVHLSELFVREPQLTRFSPSQLAQLQILLVAPTAHRTHASPLFTALKSDEIQTSPRHNGMAVFQHVFLVLQQLRFDANDCVQDKLMLAVAALYHDAGKAMAVGYGTIAQIRVAMNQYGGGQRMSDSYRTHEVVSSWVLLSLHRAVRAQLQIASGTKMPEHLLPEERLNDALFLIRFHHLCQEIYENRAVKRAAFMQLIKSAPHAPAILRWFEALSCADLLSVAHQNNTVWSQAMVEMCTQMRVEVDRVSEQEMVVHAK